MLGLHHKGTKAQRKFSAVHYQHNLARSQNIMFCLFFLHMKMFVLIYKTFNGLPSLYPSLPGVEGAQGISAGGPKARLAACTKKNSLCRSILALIISLDLRNRPCRYPTSFEPLKKQFKLSPGPAWRIFHLIAL
jgi:hypothetical protein